MLKDQRETSAASAMGEPSEAPASTAPESQVVAVRSCTVPGCAGRFLARGYCVRHYYQVKRHGMVQAAGQRFPRAASRPRPDGGDGRPSVRPSVLRREAHCMDGECAEAPFTRGLCRLHYIMARSQDLLA